MVIVMKLSIKMAAIFSAMMLIALCILTSYAVKSSIDGASAFTRVRFANMAASIQRDLEQDISQMELTLNSLTESSTFMASLNQMVRDDSDDQKMGNAAKKAAVQHLYQSPLVNNYYRVSFYTRDGLFITSRADKDSSLISGTVQANVIINNFSWLDAADETTACIMLPLHPDVFSAKSDIQVYGIVQQVLYHGKCIGYLEISKSDTDLQRIMEFVDNPAVLVQAVFDDGTLLFSSTDQALDWPEDMAHDTYTLVSVGESGEKYNVYCTVLENLHLKLYIGQLGNVDTGHDQGIRIRMFKYAMYIMIPTLLLILLFSFGLTASTRRLTQKVRQLPVNSILSNDPEVTRSLSTTVARHGDHEIYALEQVFNTMMLRLRQSTSNELTLREGALQARLSALQTQINPHFIYNTLNIISAKAMESGNFDIIEICDQFAQMLRYSTDTRSQTATLSEEIENVRNYLLLAKARYEDNLEFTISVPENTASIALPKLTLQPIVENALTHGFDGNNVLRKLSILGSTRMDANLGECLQLEIRDNGTGFSREMLESLNQRIAEIKNGHAGIELSGGHIGLFNTCLRLYYYSKGAMRIELKNDNGAVVTLIMPIENK